MSEDGGRGNAGIAIAVTFTGCSLLTLGARLYTRFALVKNHGHEEIAIVFAWVFAAAHAILVCVEIHNGLGLRSDQLTVQQQEHVLLPFYVSVSMYSISLCLSKVSILLLYMRLFPSKWFAIANWITVGVLLVFLVWACFGFMFMCRPIAFLWDKSLTGTCMDGRVVYFTSAAFNIFTDFVVFGLPLPILARLQLPRKQKIVLILLFGFGLVGCLTSVLRLRSLYQLSVSTDYTYDILDAAIWSCVESNVGFFCACVPTLKPLLTRILPHLLSDYPAARNHRRSSYLTHMNCPEVVLNGGRMPSHRAYAQFDIEESGGRKGGLGVEPGQVRVTTTTSVVQEVEDRDAAYGAESGEDEESLGDMGLKMEEVSGNKAFGIAK